MRALQATPPPTRLATTVRHLGEHKFSATTCRTKAVAAGEREAVDTRRTLAARSRTHRLLQKISQHCETHSWETVLRWARDGKQLAARTGQAQLRVAFNLYETDALLALGRFPDAVRSANEAQQQAASLGVRAQEARAIANLYSAYCELGCFTVASPLLRRIKTLNDDLKDPVVIAETCAKLANALICQGELDAAAACVQYGVKFSAFMGGVLCHRQMLVATVRLELERNNYSSAEASLTELANLSPRPWTHRAALEVRALKGELALKRGQPAAALRCTAHVAQRLMQRCDWVLAKRVSAVRMAAIPLLRDPAAVLPGDLAIYRKIDDKLQRTLCESVSGLIVDAQSANRLTEEADSLRAELLDAHLRQLAGQLD